MKDYSQPLEKDYSQPIGKEYSQSKESSERTVSQLKNDVIIGAAETLLSGATGVVGRAGAGLTRMFGESAETAQKVEEVATFPVTTPMGKAISKEVSKPFEWYSEEGTRIGQEDSRSLEWLIGDHWGVDKDTARVIAGVFGASTEAAIRAIPDLLAIKGVTPKLPAFPKPYERGVNPEAIDSKIGDFVGLESTPTLAPLAPKPIETGSWKKPVEEPITQGRTYEEVAIEPEILTSTEFKKSAPYKVYEEFKPGIDKWTKEVLDKEGTSVGLYEGIIDKQKQEFVVRTQEVFEGSRKQGLGSTALKEVVDHALDNKLTVKSDATLSEGAVGTWESLSKTGDYIVERNPDAVEKVMSDGTNRLVSEEVGVPVFKVYDRTLKGYEVSKPAIDYGKIQEAAIAEDLTRSVTKELNKPLDKQLTRNLSTLIDDERPVHELKPDLYTVTTRQETKFGTGATTETIRSYSPTFKDLPDRYGVGGRLIPGRGQYISSGFLGRVKHNPLLRWVDSMGKREELWIKQKYHEEIFGTDVVMKRGKPVYQPTQRGWSVRFNELPLDQRMLYGKARDIFDDPQRAKELGRVDKTILEDMGLSKEAIDLYYSTSDMYTRTVGSVNSTIREMKRVGYDLEEFTQYEGYNPHIWTGDFRTFIKDKAGNVLRVVPNNTIVGRTLTEHRLKKEFGDRYEISSVTKKSDLNDLSIDAINDLIVKAEEKFPEQATEIREFLNAQKDIKGMGVHGIHRKGAKGYLGDTSNHIDPVKVSAEIQQATETFVHGMLRKEASLRLRFNMDALRSDPAIARLYPNTLEYGQRAINDFLGKKTQADQIISTYTESFAGPSGVSKVVETGSKIMTYPVLLFHSVPNIIVQPFQIGYGVVKSVGLRNELGLSAGEVHVSWAKALKNMGPGKTPELKEVAIEAGKRGAVAPEFVQFMHETDALQGRPLQNRAWYKDMLTGKLAYSVPDEYSRLAQVYGFYETLIAAKKPHKTAMLDAIALAKEYSVPYTNMERPAAYRGTVGVITGKFQTWSANQYAQMLEHWDTAKHGDPAPLAEYMAYSALVAGIYGFWGVQEADYLVEKVNKLFGKEYKLPSMHIAEKAPDIIAYGPLQAATNYTTGSTTLPAFNRRLTSFPVIDFYAELTASTTNLLSKYMGLGSPVDKMDIERAMIAWAPRSMHGPLKVAIEKGDIYLLPKDYTLLIHDSKTAAGSYRLDRQGQIVSYLGGKTIEDHKASMINRWVQGIEENRKLTLKDWATYVAISSSMGVPVDLEKFKEKVALEFKITPKEFSEAVSTAAKKFNTSIKERVFSTQSEKGRRAGAKFYELIEQDKPKDYSIPKEQ